MMNNNKPEECTVCFGNYDDGLLRPRLLPCGATVCSQCINNAIKNGHLTDHSCYTHISTDATQFPINHTVEAFVRRLKALRTNPMMINNKPEECPVCFGNYDGGLLRPRLLPCGDAVCSQCMDNAIKNGHLTCPSCYIHISTAATQFPINYGVEAFVKKLTPLGVTPSSSPAEILESVGLDRDPTPLLGGPSGESDLSFQDAGGSLSAPDSGSLPAESDHRDSKGIHFTSVETVPAIPCQAPARGISKQLLSQIQSSMSSLITECEETLSQLEDWKPQHLQLQDKLYGLIEQTKIAMKILEQEGAIVVGMTTLEKEKKTLLQFMLNNF